ncbi:MAG: 4Fe-4S binding protein [Ornithinimicrobium sp.]
MYCGICIEVCPFDALFWAPDFAYADGDIRNLLHTKDELGHWMERVPDSSVPKKVRDQLGRTTDTEGQPQGSDS